MNRPGGHGRITKLHYAEDGQVVSMDVKYTLSGTDKKLEPYLVEPWQDLDRSNRRDIPPTRTGTAAPLDPALMTAVAAEKENVEREPHKGRPQRKRNTLKSLASFKKSKKATSRNVSSSSSSFEGAVSVPQLIYADDEQSVVSELDVGTGIEEPPRCYMLDSSASSKKASHRSRLQTFDTSSSHDASQTSRRSSPCSKAKSIVSGQLNVGGALESPTLKFGKRLSPTSPSAAKTLAVGQMLSPAKAGVDSTSPSSRKKHPRLLPKLYVSELKPVTEQACDETQNNMERRDDEEDEHMQESSQQDPAEKHVDETMSCHSECPRRNLFVVHLVDLLQENDGVLDEDGVLELLNPLVETPFDTSQLQEFLEYLCDENKIMRSDGQIYSI